MMRFSPKITTLGLAAVVAVALLAPVDTQAKHSHPKRRAVSSQINVSYLGPDGASGSLYSPPACQGGRQVTLFQEQTTSGAPAGQPIAVRSTSPDGSWHFPSVLYPGQYYVAVGPSHTKRFACGPSASRPQDTG